MPSGRSIRPTYSFLWPSRSTSSAIRTPSGDAFSEVIFPSPSPATCTFSGVPAPPGTRHSATFCGSRSATHRSPAASQLGAVSVAALPPLPIGIGCGMGPPPTSGTTVSPCPSSDTTAARRSS